MHDADFFPDYPQVGDTVHSAFRNTEGVIAHADEQTIVIQWSDATDRLRPDQFQRWVARVAATGWRID